jgi:hypothetical protein
MGHKIVVESFYQQRQEAETISIEQWQKKRRRRRKRVARRMAKRFPLFAAQIVAEEFKGYTHEDLEADLKGAKPRKKKKGKSQLQRQGRYPLMQQALSKYHLTGETKYLNEAQQWRKKLFLPYEIVCSLDGERRVYTFPGTVSVRVIKDLASIKFTSWEELDAIMKEKLKWVHLS